MVGRRGVEKRGPLFEDGPVAAQRDDDMFEQLDFERPAYGRQPRCCRHVGLARCRIAARMIVDKNNCGGIELNRAPEYRAGINRNMADGALLQLFVGDQAARRVEKQHPERFMRQSAHRQFEIAKQFRIGGIDAAVVEVGPQRLDRGRLRCAKQCADRAVFAKRSRQRLRGLHEDARERAMFR